MGKGYIKLNREIQDSWLWNEKPFSRAQAWIDLLLLANYKDKKELYRGNLVYRKRGQVACSMLWLSKRWGWSREKVKKFLTTLVQDEMATIETTTQATTITIENYAKWQDCTTTEPTAQRQPTDNPPTTHRHTKERKRKKKEQYKERRRTADPRRWSERPFKSMGQ